MIAVDFWGVKARKTAELFGLLRLVVPYPKLPNPHFLFSFALKETVRIPPHVLNSARIIQSRGKSKRLKYVRPFPPNTKRNEKSTRLNFYRY